MKHSSLLTLQDDNHRDSAWERAANYEKEERPVRRGRKIVVKGAVDVVFFRSPSAHLVVTCSGDADASELVATSAKLSVAGSGDIDAYVSNSAKARVAGSGDIVIRGNPPIREHSVAGSGDMKFKK